MANNKKQPQQKKQAPQQKPQQKSSRPAPTKKARPAVAPHPNTLSNGQPRPKKRS